MLYNFANLVDYKHNYTIAKKSQIASGFDLFPYKGKVQMRRAFESNRVDDRSVVDTI